MAENSNIEWTDHTFNPWIGCTKVSPGCDHCYAETWDARGLQQRESRWGPQADRTRTSAANWNKPRQWDRAAAATGKRARVFCASLADVFDNHASILPEWRVDLWKLVDATPHLDWLMLTKRPQNAPRALPDNVWIGTTVENQTEADRRIPHLLRAPARIRFLSVEPMLGPVDLERVWMDRVEHRFGDSANLPGLSWVICGGESGPGARPMQPDWARSLRDQCNAAGVAFHFKQWGNWHSDALLYTDMSGNCPPPNMNIGKKAAGRMLDGRTWDELPGADSGETGANLGRPDPAESSTALI